MTRVFMVMTPTGPHAQFGCALVPMGGEPMEKFWIVIGPRNTTSSRHPNPELAKREAERLCRDTLKPFVVMEAMAVCEPTSPPVRWSPLPRPT